MPIKKWKLLSSKPVFVNRWWNIVQETVELPDGSITDDYYVNHNLGGVMVFALTEQGKVVLNRQYKHGAREIVEELTIGRLDEDDGTPLEAARREFLEETGYGGGAWKEIGAFITNATSSTARIHVFLAEGVRKVAAPRKDPREIVEVSEVTPAELLKRVMDGRMATDASAAAVFLAAARLGWLEVKV